MPRSRRSIALALAAAALVPAACSGPADGDPPVATPADAGLTGTFDQGRTQVERRLARATLTLAEGAEPVEVAALELLLPGFTSAGPQEQGTRFEPGRTIALPSAYGEASCDDDSVGGRVEVLATLTGADEPVRLVLDDPRGVAAALHVRECAAQRAAALAPMAWQPVWTTEGAGPELVSVGRLDVGPVTGEQPVIVEGLDPTTLFAYDVAPHELAPGERAELQVRLTPTRCDLHAVAEDKLGFAPPVRLRVGDEVLVTPVWVPVEQRSGPLAALLERCGAA